MSYRKLYRTRQDANGDHKPLQWYVDDAKLLSWVSGIHLRASDMMPVDDLCGFIVRQLVKVFGPAIGGVGRYSPPQCLGTRKRRVEGRPDPAHISTSYVERQNLTMRMSMRRFTRLTNAFSKKLDNHIHALALYFVFYNFCRIHNTLRISPAMAANITDRLWSMEDVIAKMDEMAGPPKPRGPYKKRQISN